ncbi:MAG: hypothetical protein RLZZ599_471, partial [Bacteroidota bacterium]
MNLNVINIKELGGILPEGTTALRGHEMRTFSTIENAFLTIENGKISGFGSMAEFSPNDHQTLDASGQCVMPAFVDSHSHLVYSGTRESEFNMRLQGASYEEIAAAGGGILNSASRVASTTQEEMMAQSMSRLERLVQYGTGTIEVKSGYGLDPENELKMLRTVKEMNALGKATLIPTFLAAHALPGWAKAQGLDDASYTKFMLDACLPTIQNEGLAQFIDGFIERDYFKLDALQYLIEASKASGLPL